MVFRKKGGPGREARAMSGRVDLQVSHFESGFYLLELFTQTKVDIEI